MTSSIGPRVIGPWMAMRRLSQKRGLTLLEMAIALAVTAMIVGPIGGILWQVLVVPSDTSGALRATSQSRIVELDVSDDARAGQFLVTGDDPLWASTEWTDFTGTTAQYHTVEYRWDSTEKAMVRVVVVEGAAAGSLVSGRFLGKFADAGIRYTGDLPYLVSTSVTAEVDTALGSQIRTGSMVSYLRAPAPLSQPIGGYAAFSTNGLDISGGNNLIIGNVYTTGRIRFTGRNQQIAGFVEATNGIDAIPDTLFFLHNDPTPPTGDTPSHAVLPIDVLGSFETTLFNYDTDRDTDPGLLILKGGSGATEADLTKHQVWRTDPQTVDLELDGDVLIELWTALTNFQLSSGGQISVFLRDRSTTGDYVEIGGATLSEADWQLGASDFVQKVVTILNLQYTVVTDHELEIKVIVDAASSSDMWLAYDTATHDSLMRLEGSPLRAVIEFMHVVASVKSPPISFSTGDFQPFTYSFVGDVNLKDIADVWIDAGRTQLKPGVYYTTGTLILKAGGTNTIRGQVTLIANTLEVRSRDLRLTPFLKGVVFFAFGSVPQGQSAISLGGRLDNSVITGIVYAPNGSYNIAGSARLDGSIIVDGLDWKGSGGRIAFNADLFEE